MNESMVSAIKSLKTQSWGRFFFALPVQKNFNSVKACDILRADEARVIIPDSAITLAHPLYGEDGWSKHGTIGSLDYPGSLIPLHVVAVLNPEFDFIKVLKHGQRRQEYEAAVVKHFNHIKSTVPLGQLVVG